MSDWVVACSPDSANGGSTGASEKDVFGEVSWVASGKTKPVRNEARGFGSLTQSAISLNHKSTVVR